MHRRPDPEELPAEEPTNDASPRGGARIGSGTRTAAPDTKFPDTEPPDAELSDAELDEADDRAQLDAEGSSADDSDEGDETEELAQPPGPNGVGNGMASIVLDQRSFEGSRAGQYVGAPQLGGLAGALTDAEIMLRVRDGDDSGFTYLIEK